MNSIETKSYPNGLQSLGIAGLIILGSIVFAPLYFLLDNILGIELTMLLFYILALGIPFWIAYSIRKKRTGSASFNLIIENKKLIPLVIIGTLTLMVGVISPLGELIPMSDGFKKTLIELSSHKGIFSFILLVIAAPLFEELIFRGIILEGMLKNYSPVKAILLSSVLFAVVHLNPWQFVAGFIIGIFAGWLYYKTRSIAFPLIIHASANLFAYSMRVFLDLELIIDMSLAEFFGGYTNLIIVIAGSIVVGSICIYFLKRNLGGGELAKYSMQ
jgi:uncharacterized protein